MTGTATVFVVDDDPAVRDSLSLLLEEEDFAVATFNSAEEFLTTFRPAPRCCAIVDMRMPGMDGMQLQGELSRRGILLPLIFLTGHGDIPLCKRAIMAGAFDFLTKPVTAAALMQSVREALLESEKLAAQAELTHTAKTRIGSLTERERQVMALAIEGLTNKEIARRLSISYRTVEIHRARIMYKTGVDNLIDLARIASEASRSHP